MRGLGCRRDNKYKQMVQGSSPVQGKVKLLIKVQTFINKIFSVKTDLQMPKILASTTFKIFFLHKHQPMTRQFLILFLSCWWLEFFSFVLIFDQNATFSFSLFLTFFVFFNLLFLLLWRPWTSAAKVSSDELKVFMETSF